MGGRRVWESVLGSWKASLEVGVCVCIPCVDTGLLTVPRGEIRGRVAGCQYYSGGWCGLSTGWWWVLVCVDVGSHLVYLCVCVFVYLCLSVSR